MDELTYTATRRALHAVGESVIAGPQYRTAGTIRLRVTPGGFGGVQSELRVEGTDLVGADGRRPIEGSLAALDPAAGPPEGLYHDTSGVELDDELMVDADAAAVIAEWFARGDAALRAFAPDVEPVLWPEHFDLGLSLDEVNFGISPGDAAHPRPYAYVGPWTPREGEFWNAPFGALRWADDLPDAAAVAAFFARGRAASRA